MTQWYDWAPGRAAGARLDARGRLLALLALPEAARLLLELAQDVRRGGVHDVLGCVEQGGDVLALGLRFRRYVPLGQRPDLPAGGDHAPLVADTVVGAAPRRLGSQVDPALPHAFAVVVGAALVVLAV